MNSSRGVTLIEIMITLVIAAGVLSLGFFTLSAVIPKENLKATVSEVENIVKRAQAEATTQVFYTCLEFDDENDPRSVTLWVDKNSNHGTADSCGDSGDQKITTSTFKKDVQLVTSGCTGAITGNCIIWFDTTGAPKRCPNSGTSCEVSSTGCIDGDYQLIFRHPAIESPARARELEIVSGGLIKAVKPGEKGEIASQWATGPGLSGGCE